MILGNSLKLPVPQFPPQYNGNGDSTYLILLSGSNKLTLQVYRTMSVH